MTENLRTRWAERYRNADVPPIPVTSPRFSAVVDSIMNHRTVRAYLPDALPDGLLEWGIAAASSAATSSNLQTWSVVAVKDKARRDRLATLCGNQEHIRQAPVFLAWVADLSRLERAAVQEDQHDLVLDYSDFFLTSVIDASITAQNAANAYEAAGLGTVYIGGARNNPEEISSLLQLPPRSFAAFGMCVGWPDPTRPTGIKPRLPQSVVLHHETYQGGRERPFIEQYDEQASAFQVEQNLPPRTWTSHAAKNAADHDLVDPRKDLSDVLTRLGFPRI